MIHRRSKIVPFPRPIRSPRLAPRSAFRIRSFSAWTCANLREKILVLHGFPGEQLAAFLRRVPFPTTCTFNSYRCLTAPYRYLTGSGPAFRSMFMRVLTGLTGPDPQGWGGAVSNRPPFPRNSVMNQNFMFAPPPNARCTAELPVKRRSAPH